MANELFSSIGSFIPSGGLIRIVVIVGLTILIVGLIAGAIIYYFHRKKNWNMEVEFKIPRSDGRIVNAEWGKGMYDTKRGVVLIKRKGKKAVSMKPFDVKRYLQGGNLLTVVQVGAEQYIPVFIESYLEMVDEKTGEEGALMKIKIDTTESKSWKNSFEREAKSAYSIIGLLAQYAPYIGIGLVLIFNFIGFAILYGKIKG